MNDLQADTIIEYVRNSIKIPTLTAYFHDPDKQHKRLGRFNKETVHIPAKPLDTKFRFLAQLNGLIVPPDPKDELMWNDINVYSTKPYAFIGVTGAGKTHKIFGTARYGYMLYFTAADRPDEKDHTVSLLYATISDNEGKNSAYVYLWIASKLLGLLILLQDYPDMTPEQFFLSQLNGKSQYYADCYTVMLEKGVRGTIFLCRMLIERIRTQPIVVGNKNRLGIAVDEASILQTKNVGR
jgi:hypothetical protein